MRSIFLLDLLNCCSTVSTVTTGQFRYTCIMQIASRRSSDIAARMHVAAEEALRFGSGDGQRRQNLEQPADVGQCLPWTCVQSCHCGSRSRLVLLPRPHRVLKMEFSPHQLLLVQKLGIAHYSALDVFPWFQMRWQQAAQFERHLLPLTEPCSELPKDAVEQAVAGSS